MNVYDAFMLAACWIVEHYRTRDVYTLKHYYKCTYTKNKNKLRSYKCLILYILYCIHVPMYGVKYVSYPIEG